MLLFYHKIHRNSTAHPILHAPIEIGNPLQNPLGGIRQNKDAEAPCEHGCGFSERDLAEQQTAAGDEENQRRQLIGDELRNASAKMPSHSTSVSRAVRDRPVFHCRTSQGEALIYFSALIPQETVKNLFFAESSRI